MAPIYQAPDKEERMRRFKVIVDEHFKTDLKPDHGMGWEPELYKGATMAYQKMSMDYDECIDALLYLSSRQNVQYPEELIHAIDHLDRKFMEGFETRLMVTVLKPQAGIVKKRKNMDFAGY